MKGTEIAKKIKVKIQIKFKNGHELTLGEEEAKELFDKLNELFGEKTVYPIIYRYPYYEWYPTSTPCPTTNPYWKTTCKSGSFGAGGGSVGGITDITYSCNLSNGG